MKHSSSHRPEARVFIASLRSFEVVFLPATGQIVSRFDARAAASRDRDRQVGTGSQKGADEGEAPRR